MFEVGTMEMHEASEFYGTKPVPFNVGDEKIYIMLFEESDKYFIGTLRMCVCMKKNLGIRKAIYALEVNGGDIALLAKVRFPECEHCHGFIFNLEANQCQHCDRKIDGYSYPNNFERYGDAWLICGFETERDFWFNHRLDRNWRKCVMDEVRTSVKLVE